MRPNSTSQPEVYLNALPWKPDVLDLSNVHREGIAFLDSVLKKLISEESFSLTIEPDERQRHQLKHLFFESKNLERLRGFRTLTVGFPLYQETTDAQMVVAPALLWPVELEPIVGAQGNWLLKYSGQLSPQVNTPLVKYLTGRFDVDAETAIAEFHAALTNQSENPDLVVKTFCEKLKIQPAGAWSQWIAVPGVDEMGLDHDHNYLRMSAVMGVFPPVLDVSKTDIRELNQRLERGELNLSTQQHTFAILPADPWQETALQKTLRNRSLVLTGAPGTGKTTVAANLIFNALSNGKKCLVLSNRVSTLLNLQKTVSSAVGVSMHYLLKNGDQEKLLFLEVLKAKVQEGRVPVFDESSWRFLLTKCMREKNRLDEKYEAVHGKVFGMNSWTDLVGLFLKNNRVEGKELLASQLKPQDFSFSFDEYVALEDGILRCKQLFGEIGTLTHQLQNLHPTLFTSMSAEPSKAALLSNLQDFKKKAYTLHHRYIQKMDAYQTKLTEHHELQFRKFAEQHDNLHTQIEDAESRYRSEFSEGFYDWVELKSIFSKKSRQVFELKKSVREQFQQLRSEFEKTHLFESHLATGGEGRYIPDVRKALEQFHSCLLNWHGQIPVMVHEEIQRLNNKSVNSNLDFQEQIQDLEYSLDVLIEELNEAKIYHLPFENKMLTLPKQQQFLEDIIGQLEDTELQLRDFDRFHRWHRHWLSLPEIGQKVVRALVRVKANDWLAAFESWYFHNRLKISQSPSLPVADISLAEFVSNQSELQALMPGQIEWLWAGRREKALAAIRKSNRPLYQYFEGRAEKAFLQKSLSEMIGPSDTEVADLMPLVFSTPDAVMATFSESEKIFDWLIVEEAGMLDLHEVVHAAGLCSQILVIGDKGPHTEEGEPTLLEWALTDNLPSINLPNRYSSALERLSQFNLAAFQQVPPDLKKLDSMSGGIRLIQSEGKYHEKDRINESQAQEVLHLLNQIKPTPQQTLPSVGIACFTPQQRDLILDYLLQTKQRNAPGAEKILQLERNGLGVFYIGNMRSERFDLVIVSGTFGVVNAAGKMTSKIEQLNTELGLQKIYTMSASPRQHLTLLTSLPAAFVEKVSGVPEKRGLFLLSNFIKYLDACQREDVSAQQHILEKILEKDGAASANVAPDTFLSEIAHALEPYFEPGRIQSLLEFENLKIPLCALSEFAGKPTNYILSDGFVAKTQHTSYTWEMEQRQKIEAHQLQIFPVWSVAWWKNAPQQARKLASLLIKQEADLTPFEGGES